jgi:hypothetical protein
MMIIMIMVIGRGDAVFRRISQELETSYTLAKRNDVSTIYPISNR